MSLPAANTPVAPTTVGPVLRDIHLPPEPAWWPPAPGWWVLAVLLLLLLAVVAWQLRKWRQRRAQYAMVGAEVDTLAARHADDAAALAAGLHQLLRRVARQYDPGATQTYGAAWRQTLAVVPVDAATLDRLMTLEATMYRPQVSFDQAAVIAATRQWLTGALRHSRKPARDRSSIKSSVTEPEHV
ncbi:DUF4381 family protein [Dyella tabacisoli]|uniref:DUF4381 family protein n=1 Tax=Dyella tabacisoli TaxID=2282381 RepID=A0A369UMG0_9GAMM|nr:DUF4381 family protein [Dyella tabacisoli]RDD81944.1 DUF4381 family protein [Dyella tabacisoli]